MAGTTSRLSTRPYGTSMSFWHDGLIGNSSPFDATSGDRGIGSIELRGDSPGCLLTGASFKGAAEHWEPYEGRPSRTVLRAPGGETPLGDSPTGALPD